MNAIHVKRALTKAAKQRGNRSEAHHNCNRETQAANAHRGMLGTAVAVS